MTSFLIDGEQVRPGSGGFVEAVAAAHANRSRPRCLCSPSRPAMCIARMGPQFVLRRMPGTGGEHDDRCRSWAGEMVPRTTRQRSSQSRRLSVNPNLRSFTGNGIASGPPPSLETVAPRQIPMSLPALLLRLWRQAALTEWHPQSDEQRSWDTVRRHLLDAATSLRLNDHLLADRLYVPEPFDLGQVTDIYARRRARWSEIRRLCSRQKRPALVIAEVRAVMQTKQGSLLALRHIPDRCLYLPRAPLAQTEMLDPTQTRRDPRQAHLIVMTPVDLVSAWHWRPDSAVMPVDSLWRPLVQPPWSDIGQDVHSLRDVPSSSLS